MSELSKLHRFNKSLEIGLAAEEQFLQRFPALTKSDSRRQDFLTPSGKKVELKSDSYDPARTTNYFIELVSVIEDDRVGGPFQSLHKGVHFYCYQYVQTSDLYIFDVEALCARVLQLMPGLDTARVRNYGYSTLGLKVPRSLLVNLQLGEEVLSV
jgi:hypothetical protein